MFNILLMTIEFIFLFSMVPIAKKMFGKTGLVGLMVMNLILANIQVIKIINFGTSWSAVALGSVAFAANFLITDIISYVYSEKEARRSIRTAVMCYVIFFIGMQLTLMYQPDATDYASSAFKTVFGTDGLYIWVSVGSLLSYFIGNTLDTYIFGYFNRKIKSKGPGSLWVKSSLSGIANLIENFIFGALGYVLLPMLFKSQVIMPLGVAFSSSIFGTIFEGVVTILCPIFMLIGTHKYFINRYEGK